MKELRLHDIVMWEYLALEGSLCEISRVEIIDFFSVSSPSSAKIKLIFDF